MNLLKEKANFLSTVLLSMEQEVGLPKLSDRCEECRRFPGRPDMPINALWPGRTANGNTARTLECGPLEAKKGQIITPKRLPVSAALGVK